MQPLSCVFVRVCWGGCPDTPLSVFTVGNGPFPGPGRTSPQGASSGCQPLMPAACSWVDEHQADLAALALEVREPDLGLVDKRSWSPPWGNQESEAGLGLTMWVLAHGSPPVWSRRSYFIVFPERPKGTV